MVWTRYDTKSASHTNIPMELQHVQGSDVHPLPGPVDVLLNEASCHLNRRRHPLCKPAQTAQQQSKAAAAGKSATAASRWHQIARSPPDLFQHLGRALAPDFVDEHAVQILRRPICQIKKQSCLYIQLKICQYRNRTLTKPTAPIKTNLHF